MITYKIHFIRSGSAYPDAEKRYVGQSDAALCQDSAALLERLHREWEYPRVEMVVTSPLQRCVQTADILYPETYTEQMEGLMDMDLGLFEGRTLTDLQGDEDFDAWLRNSLENPPPGGETTEDFTHRIILAVSGLFARMMEERIANVADISDGGVILSLLASIGLPKQPMGMWATEEGTGYTVLFTPQMWMRDGSAEVYARIPIPMEEIPGQNND